MKRILIIVCGIAAAALLAPTAARAELVVGDVFLIDFNDAAGHPSGGDTWNWPSNDANFVIGSETLALVNSGGGGSPLTIQCTDDMRDSTNNTSGWVGPPGPDWVDSNASGDYYFLYWNAQNPGSVVAGTTGAVTIFGLDDDLEYTVELVSSKNDSNAANPYVATYTLDDSTADQQVSSTGFNSYTSGYLGEKVMIWDSVGTGGDGELTLKMDTVAYGKLALISAMRIEVVPEPATMGLLGLGFAGMAVLRRRRRNK